MGGATTVIKPSQRCTLDNVRRRANLQQVRQRDESSLDNFTVGKDAGQALELARLVLSCGFSAVLAMPKYNKLNSSLQLSLLSTVF